MKISNNEKKGKRDGLTDEIRKFLKEPVTEDSIKLILLKLLGNHKDPSIFDISFFTLSKFSFIIRIQQNKEPFPYIFYVSLSEFSSPEYFFDTNITKSLLKQELAHSIREWLFINKKAILA